MVSTAEVRTALSSIREAELSRLGRIAHGFLFGHSFSTGGEQGHKTKSGAGTEFVDYREYAAGDDTRTIDWRASARSNRLHVKRHRDDVYSRWIICLDRSASMGIHDGEKWLTAVQISAALAYLMLHNGAMAGLITYSDGADNYCSPGHGRRQYSRIISALHGLVPRDQGGASTIQACAPYLPRGSSVIVISDFLAPDAMLNEIEVLSRSCDHIHLLQVLSHRECDPQGESTLLMDIETGERQLSEPGQSSTSAASSRLNSLCNELRAACRRRGMGHCQASTATKWSNILLKLLTKYHSRHA